MLSAVYFFLRATSWAFLFDRSSLQSWSMEQPVCCYRRLRVRIAASSLVRWTRAIRRISLMISDRREYHCSSLCRPARQRLPQRLSRTVIAGWPRSPTVHSLHRSSTVFVVRHILCCGGCSCDGCSCTGCSGAGSIKPLGSMLEDNVRGLGASVATAVVGWSRRRPGDSASRRSVRPADRSA